MIRALWTALILTSLTGCHSHGPAHGLRVGLSAEPVSLDPALAEDGAAMKVLGNTMDGLFGYDATGKLVPRLARAYSISKDGRRYEFQIDTQAKWSDGKPVEAAQFVAGFRRALTPGKASKLAPLFYPIRHAREVQAGKLPVEKLGVRAEGDRLILELSEPASYFLHAMTLTEALPAREELLGQNGGKWKDDFPGTGPYHIVRHDTERSIVLEKNPYYSSEIRIPQVEFMIVPDERTGLNLFEQGKIDIVGKIPQTEFKRLRDKIHTDPFPATYYISFNLKKAPFDRVETRRAVSAAILKNEIVQLLETGESPAESWIPDGIEGSFTKPLPQVSQSRKPALSGPVIAGFDSSERNRMIMEKIQQDLLSRLGLKLSLENMDWKTYIGSLQADAPPLFRFAWLAPFNDPIVHLRVFQTGNPNNYSHFSNAEYDHLVEDIVRLQPGVDRDRKLKRAQEILQEEEAVVVPLYHYVQNHLVSNRVEGFRVSPYGVIRFSELGLRN